MELSHTGKITEELKLKKWQVEATIGLLEDDATVPFIARYRKEKTGSLDEVQITDIRDLYEKAQNLEKRREAILKSLAERDILADELKKSIEAASTIVELEDIYLPYKPKKRTRGTVAKERGLEPLAQMLFAQNPELDVEKAAEEFVNEEKKVITANQALEGARDIISEWINEDKDAREQLREFFYKESALKSKVIKDKEEDGSNFRDYFDWEEKASKVPSHRYLAIMRGEREGFLRVKVRPSTDKGIQMLNERFVIGQSPASEQVELAIISAYKRLLSVSMETEYRNHLKEKADDEAIIVFAKNLRELFMAPPLGQKPVIAIDPGYRTGCKVVTLDAQGKFLENKTIFITQSEEKAKEARKIMSDILENHKCSAIAIGNGTGNRETFEFIESLDLPDGISVVNVNESGASIYSASKVAREEFPDEDVTVRGAISIGRRLQDPLAELVKIDPKSIGVGQYQHDVDQKKLKSALDDVVVSAVNAVGVEVNTSSKQLLSYVSGLGPALAGNIVEYRNKNGPIKKIDELLKVKRLGPKAFEQAAGFVRVRDSENPLDRSAVHPESYAIVEKMAKYLDVKVKDLMENKELRQKINLKDYVTDDIGMPTLTDIIKELAKPGRDPRGEFEAFSFSDKAKKLSDLEVGMVLPGIVTNVTKFGAFVDIGVHQDGLIHISEIANRFVKDPAEILKANQTVKVKVIEVDKKRNRISLSMKALQPKKPRKPRRKRKTSPTKKQQHKKPPKKKDNRPPEQKLKDYFKSRGFKVRKLKD
ncbi:MAG: Tex family protein [Candidatus Zixiibacteriota bacterium]